MTVLSDGKQGKVFPHTTQHPVNLSEQIADMPEFPYCYYSVLAPRISDHWFGSARGLGAGGERRAVLRPRSARGAGHGGAAVSYTHLDVYKRQAPVCAQPTAASSRRSIFFAR